MSQDLVENSNNKRCREICGGIVVNATSKGNILVLRKVDFVEISRWKNKGGKRYSSNPVKWGGVIPL